MYIYVNLWANSTKSTLLKPKWEWMRYNYILEKNDIFTNVYKKKREKNDENENLHIKKYQYIQCFMEWSGSINKGAKYCTIVENETIY